MDPEPPILFKDILNTLLEHVQQNRPRYGLGKHGKINDVDKTLKKFVLYQMPFVCALLTNCRLQDLRYLKDDRDLVASARLALSDLKSARDDLSKHLKTLKEASDSIETSLRPFEFGRGIESLPEDVLRMIFEAADNINDEPDFVCRDFQRIVTSTPRLWRKVSNALPEMNLLLEYVYASAEVGLDVSLHVGEPDMVFNSEHAHINLLEAIDELLPESERWEVLSFYISIPVSEDVDDDDGPLIEMAERLSHLELPRLRVMRYEVSTGFKFMDSINSLDSFLHYYNTFTLPNLRRLEIANFIPVPFSAPALTSVRIELWNENADVLNFDNLVRFLSSIPKLENLTLHLLSFSAPPLEAIPQGTLECLTTFDMVAHVELCHSLQRFMEALVMPAVVKMRLELRHRAWIPNTNWMTFFLCGQEYPTLEELSINVVLNLNDRPSFSIPFQKVPNLCSLSIYSPQTEIGLDAADIPPLKTIKIHTDSLLWMSYLRRLGARMERQGNLKDLEKVVILRREWDAVQAAEIKGYFKGQQVEWKEVNGDDIDD